MFFLVWMLPGVIRIKCSLLCKVQCVSLLLITQIKIQHIFPGMVWWLTILELARDSHNAHFCFAAPKEVVRIPICLSIWNWHTGQANLSFSFCFVFFFPGPYLLVSATFPFTQKKWWQVSWVSALQMVHPYQVTLEESNISLLYNFL